MRLNLRVRQPSSARGHAGTSVELREADAHAVWAATRDDSKTQRQRKSPVHEEVEAEVEDDLCVQGAIAMKGAPREAAGKALLRVGRQRVLRASQDEAHTLRDERVELCELLLDCGHDERLGAVRALLACGRNRREKARAA